MWMAYCHSCGHGRKEYGSAAIVLHKPRSYLVCQGIMSKLSVEDNVPLGVVATPPITVCAHEVIPSSSMGVPLLLIWKVGEGAQE